MAAPYERQTWGRGRVKLYSEAIEKMDENPYAPPLFRAIFKNSSLPFRDPAILNMFLNEIDKFEYTHSEKLGDAFEHLLSFMGTQGEAGQFRTPRHIIDFIVEIVNPKKHETILDPACGTAGFLISSYKHILEQNKRKTPGDKLGAEERKKLNNNLFGYDISPDMVRLSLVNMHLHQIANPQIIEYDTLSSEDKWNEFYDVILANPPFFSPTGGIQPHTRFGVQSKRAEVLFVDYIMQHLKPNGRAGVIVPEGIIFQAGNAYKTLRKNLIEDCLVGVISLPPGVFNPYSGVRTSILILDKKLNQKSDSIFFAKVENDGYSLSVQRTPIKENDLDKVLKLIQSNKFDNSYLFEINKSKILERIDFSFSLGIYLDREISNSKFPMVKLGDVAEFQNGCAFKPSDWGEEGKPIIRIQNLTKSAKSINRTTLEVDPKYHVESGDLLISWSATIGVFIWEGEPAILNQHIFLVKPNERILKKYLYFLGLKIKENIERLVHGNTMTHITKGKFLDIEIPLPPMEVQREIVAELDGYQKVIDGCNQVIENYKPTIDIDPSWEMVTLGDVAEFKKGTTITKKGLKKGSIPVIAGGRKPAYFHNEVNRIENSITISSSGAYAGFVSFHPYPIFASDCFTVTPKSDLLDQKFIFYLLKSKQEHIYSLQSGAAQPHIYARDFNDFEIPLPPIEVQREIVEKLDAEQAVIEGNKKLIEIHTQKIQDRMKKVWGRILTPALYLSCGLGFDGVFVRLRTPFLGMGVAKQTPV